VFDRAVYGLPDDHIECEVQWNGSSVAVERGSFVDHSGIMMILYVRMIMILLYIWVRMMIDIAEW